MCRSNLLQTFLQNIFYALNFCCFTESLKSFYKNIIINNENDEIFK